MLRKVWVLAAFLVALSGITTAAQEKKGPLYATIKTSAGDVVVLLFEDKAPKTVANFVGLATGTKEWTDPKSRQQVKRPLYNGTIFHRVIAGFMIQGGDPEGTGFGGPGYTIKDELPPSNRNARGTISMANAGPNTGGSQFFINVVDNRGLDRKHPVFGRVVAGMEIVDAISRTAKDSQDRPRTKVTIQKASFLP